ncbi:MAG TPA: PQQ-binding-like beta-propeller repeat protein [Bacteroidales bacterium]|jgi:outer membrane protein assembly factor BamB|nr:PQQ-binding-like beta-propeller repeat protein [Bacteroidales bacterium]
MSSKQPTLLAKVWPVRFLSLIVLSLGFTALTNGQAIAGELHVSDSLVETSVGTGRFAELVLSTSNLPASISAHHDQPSSASSFSVSDSTIGTSYTTGGPVVATRYEVNGKLFQWHWDGYSNNLLLELKEPGHREGSFRNRGTLNMVDLKTKSVKWSRPMNFNSSEAKLMGDYCFYAEKKRNHRLHPETGEVMWKNRNEFYFIDPVLQIGVGYPLQSLSNRLTAVDLSTGKELWKKNVNRQSGWDDAYMLNDNTLLISVDGLQAINLTSGHGWRYKASTFHKEIGKMIGFNAINIVFALLFDIYFWQNEPDTYSDMVSNMLIDPHENILLASKNRITKVNHSGEIQWSTPLPEKKTSKSSIFLVGSRVFMINRGHALYNRGFVTKGTPYFASFDLQSGKQLFLETITQNNEFVHTFQAVNDWLFVAFEGRIAAFSLSDGSKITEKTMVLHEGELLDQFVQAGIYRTSTDNKIGGKNESENIKGSGINYGNKKESGKGNRIGNSKANGSEKEIVFKELSSDYPNHNFIMTSKGRLFVLTDNLDIVRIYEKSDLYHEVAGNGRFTLVSNNGVDLTLLDNSSAPVAAIKASDELFINGDKLYFFDKDSFWEVDLAQFDRPLPLWDSIFRNLSRYLPAG